LGFFANCLKEVRRTKLYDFFAATPFIAWLLFSGAQILPPLTEQITLAKFFFLQISPSALRVSMVLNIRYSAAIERMRERSAQYPRCGAEVESRMRIRGASLDARVTVPWVPEAQLRHSRCCCPRRSRRRRRLAPSSSAHSRGRSPAPRRLEGRPPCVSMSPRQGGPG
jgi:hypothetical protein